MEKEEEGLGMINVAKLIPIEKRITLFGKGSACGKRRILVQYRPVSPALSGNVTTEEKYFLQSIENGLQHVFSIMRIRASSYFQNRTLILGLSTACSF
jgi:hypothetical protein